MLYHKIINLKISTELRQLVYLKAAEKGISASAFIRATVAKEVGYDLTDDYTRHKEGQNT
jgi:hypothetical protein